MRGIPNPGGACGGVVVNSYSIRLELPAGMTCSEYVAAHQLPVGTFTALPVDDWANDYWWLDRPTGESR